MNVRQLYVSAAAAGLTLLAAPVVGAGSAQALPPLAGTGSSTVDALLGATGSAQLTQTGSAGGAFKNCDEARAAGRAPIFRGEPGFGPHLDPDGDGFACPTV
ncbi:excalibur calcium-binding domain-containing protein [Nocardia flavorosea]|uniref:Excalibur calcium-binding domain-containing protein n=1 Tax=Nocardia flavorosea TaxID=53429 RepID=A0A846YMA9_9NOCA|nr:excalibur calcium-binding domain-containing protein [Nocardia flavorosea]NKY60816.1 excalibur calcium-binding domain-containing protein [Nocardia flavorosea]